MINIKNLNDSFPSLVPKSNAFIFKDYLLTMSKYFETKTLTTQQIEIIQDSISTLEQLDIRLGDKFYRRVVRKYNNLKPYFNETNNKL